MARSFSFKLQESPAVGSGDYAKGAAIPPGRRWREVGQVGYFAQDNEIDYVEAFAEARFCEYRGGLGPEGA